jgi:hypothetical protein
MSINAAFIFNSLFGKNSAHPMEWEIRRFQPKMWLLPFRSRKLKLNNSSFAPPMGHGAASGMG